VFIDIYLINILLNFRWFKRLLGFFSRWGKAMLAIIKKFFIWLGDHIIPKRFHKHTKQIANLTNHMNGYAKNPSRGTKWTLFWLCLIPKPLPIPGVPGGVAIAILVQKYNKFSYKGWLIIASAILIRNCCFLALLYGAGSL